MNLKVCDWHTVEVVMRDHVRNHPYGVCDDNPVRALVFFDPVKSNWPTTCTYTNSSRCYHISSEAKFWNPGCGGNSLFGYCVDPSNPRSRGVRLDFYMFCENPWVVDFCVLVY